MERVSYTILIDGEDVSPDTVPAKQLAEVMTKVERFIEAQAEQGGVKFKDEVPVTFHEVTSGSLAMTLSLSPLAVRFCGEVMRLIDQGRFTELAKGAQSNLTFLAGWTKRFNRSITLPEHEAIADSGVVIDPINGIRASGVPILLRGTGTLIGECVKLGGKEPKVDITRYADGLTVHAIADREMVRSLRDRIYKTVSVEGEAIWDVRGEGKDNWRIVSFKITKVNPYQGGDLVEAFSELNRVAGHRWADVNPTEYVRSLRED